MSAAPQLAMFSWVYPDGTTTGQVYLDASINEQHGAQAEVTNQQVEKGVNIVDHIRPMPGKFTIEGMITNTPLGLPATYNDGVLGSLQNVTGLVNNGGASTVQVTYQAFKFSDQFDRVREVFGDLGDAIQGAALFSIVTTLVNYESYALVNLAVPRNAQRGNVLWFTADFAAVRFVSSQLVEALPPKVQKQHRGAKPPKELTDEQKKAAARSSLRAIVKGFGG